MRTNRRGECAASWGFAARRAVWQSSADSRLIAAAAQRGQHATVQRHTSMVSNFLAGLTRRGDACRATPPFDVVQTLPAPHRTHTSRSRLRGPNGLRACAESGLCVTTSCSSPMLEPQVAREVMEPHSQRRQEAAQAVHRSRDHYPLRGRAPFKIPHPRREIGYREDVAHCARKCAKIPHAPTHRSSQGEAVRHISPQSRRWLHASWRDTIRLANPSNSVQNPRAVKQGQAAQV